jgi:hypothetical protein
MPRMRTDLLRSGQSWWAFHDLSGAGRRDRDSMAETSERMDDHATPVPRAPRYASNLGTTAVPIPGAKVRSVVKTAVKMLL